MGHAAVTILLCMATAIGAAATLERIDAERAALSGAAPAARPAIVERVLELRADLLRDNPDDPRRPVWLADQAQDLFFMLLPIDASGLVTRFGLPTPDQRDRARRVARDMTDLADRAEMELERAVLDAESGRGGGLDATVLEIERNRRVPFLRGIAACLDADFNVQDAAGRHALYGVARARLVPVADRLPDRFAATARLYAGLASFGAADYDAAAKTLQDVCTDPHARRDEAFAARLALVRCTAAGNVRDALAGLDGIETDYRGADDLLFRVLVADERFRLLRPLAPADAFGAYLALAQAGGPDSAAAREAGLSRLVRVAGPDTPLDRLPGLVAVARAGNLAATPGGRDEAIELYERLLASGRLDETAGAAAMFGLARASLDAGDRVAAVRRLTQLAGTYPASARSEPSIELAASLAGELNRMAPDDPAHRALLRDVLRMLLDRYPNLASVDRWRYRAGCLAVDDGRYEDAIHLFEAVAVDADTRAVALYRRADALRAWMATVTGTAARQLLARRLLDAVAAAEAANPDRATLARFRADALLVLDDPAGALAALPAGDGDEFSVLARIEAYRALGRRDEMTRELDRLIAMSGARAGAALVAMFEMRQHEIRVLIEQGHADEAMAEAQRELLPLAQAATHWLDEQGDSESLQLIAADGYRLAGQFDDALRLYDDLLADHPDALEVLYGLAECLYGVGARDEEAMAHYRRLAWATAADLDDHYWQSQLRMLQILSRTGRNTHRIAPYVQQLRSKDPALGGERYRREFERLARLSAP